MSTRTPLILALAFLTSLAPVSAQPTAAQCIPPDAVICLHLAKPEVLLDQLADAEMIEAITSLPLYQQQLTNPEFKEFLNIVEFLETTLETNWRTGLARLTGGGITLAVCPNDTVVVVVDAEDERLLNRLHEIFANIARSEALNQGNPDPVVTKQVNGVTAWSFDGQEAHAIIGKRFIFSNRSETLKAALDLQSQAGDMSLAGNPAFQEASRATQPDAVATAFVHLEPLMALPDFAKIIEAPRTNPLASLMLAGITQSLGSSNWLTLNLDVRDRTLTLRALTDGKLAGPDSPAAFAIPRRAGDGVEPGVRIPRRIAALSLHRDLHAFYAAKDDLFPERTSGLIFFENMMGIFFTGRDLTSEVLAQTEPQIQLVVAEQQYDPDVGTPHVKLPAFAVILRLRDPKQFGSVVEEAWQKAVGLINFTRGQQALPGLIIDRPTHRQTKFTLAYFSTTDVADKSKLDTRFNISPSLALPGDYLVLSSTDGLARDLIDALGDTADRQSTALPQTHSLLEISGTQVASVLQANRDTLVRQDMVKKGKTQQEAAAGIDLLITLLKCVDRAELNIGTENDLTQAALELKLNLPKP